MTIAMGTRWPAGLGAILASILFLEAKAREALKSATRSWINSFNDSSQWLHKSDAVLADDIRASFGMAPDHAHFREDDGKRS
jgi:hypothetical protein